MDIKVVWFNDAIMLGKSCEPIRSLSVGQRFETATVALEKLDSMFLKITYQHAAAERTYSECIPWHRVDKVIFNEAPRDRQPVEAPVKSRKKAQD